MDAWTPHAWLQARRRYPDVPVEALVEVPGRIEAALRSDLDRLDPAERDSRCFVSVIVKNGPHGEIKAKFVYQHVDRVIITALPFYRRYDKEFDLRFRVGLPSRYRPPLNFWGS